MDAFHLINRHIRTTTVLYNGSNDNIKLTVAWNLSDWSNCDLVDAQVYVMKFAS